MGTDMDDRIRTEIIPQPLVVCIILMGMDTVRVVIIGLDVPSPIGLESYDDVAENRSGNDYVLSYRIELPGRFPPVLLKTGANFLGKLPIPFIVLLRGDQIHRTSPNLLLGDPIRIVGQSGQHYVHEFLGSLRDRIADIVSVIFHSVKYVDDACEGV